MMNKDEYVAKMKRELVVWSADVDVLEANANKIKEVALLKYQKKIIALRAKRQEGERKLAAIQAITDGTWESLKASTDSVWEALKDSVHQFKSHFKKAVKLEAVAKN
jgi:hypothetical protein